MAQDVFLPVRQGLLIAAQQFQQGYKEKKAELQKEAEQAAWSSSLAQLPNPQADPVGFLFGAGKAAIRQGRINAGTELLTRGSVLIKAQQEAAERARIGFVDAGIRAMLGGQADVARKMFSQAGVDVPQSEIKKVTDNEDLPKNYLQAAYLAGLHRFGGDPGKAFEFVQRKVEELERFKAGLDAQTKGGGKGKPSPSRLSERLQMFLAQGVPERLANAFTAGSIKPFSEFTKDLADSNMQFTTMNVEQQFDTAVDQYIKYLKLHDFDAHVDDIGRLVIKDLRQSRSSSLSVDDVRKLLEESARESD